MVYFCPILLKFCSIFAHTYTYTYIYIYIHIVVNELQRGIDYNTNCFNCHKQIYFGCENIRLLDLTGKETENNYSYKGKGSKNGKYVYVIQYIQK